MLTTEGSFEGDLAAVSYQIRRNICEIARQAFNWDAISDIPEFYDNQLPSRATFDEDIVTSKPLPAT